MVKSRRRRADVNLISKFITRAPTAKAEAFALLYAYRGFFWGYNIVKLARMMTGTTRRKGTGALNPVHNNVAVNAD
jgi:hypothetical protein